MVRRCRLPRAMKCRRDAKAVLFAIADKVDDVGNVGKSIWLERDDVDRWIASRKETAA